MTDYKNTLNLPNTKFPMKAGLAQKEPKLLDHWDKNDIYFQIRQSSKNREKFILHDGPPYANGNIHMGTALNKILKDIITKFHQMDGKDSVYVPGWDCHGLPIEWKIEEEYKKNKKNKNDIPITEFRKECRDFANKWIKVHKDQFKRLGVIGDWENYYSTMSFDAEAQIVRELGKFLNEGSLYRGYKPVLWSTVEKTALADAEVEYLDHVSDTIYECGEPSIENSWKRIPISYFKIALVFILFDIELVFIFPWILNLSDPTPGSYFSFITFLIILFIGWIYAYKKGYLEWEM